MHIHRVLGDWLHWHIGYKYHFGFEKYGDCWTFIPEINKYKTVTYYTWWRFFFAVNK